MYMVLCRDCAYIDAYIDVFVGRLHVSCCTWAINK